MLTLDSVSQLYTDIGPLTLDHYSQWIDYYQQIGTPEKTPKLFSAALGDFICSSWVQPEATNLSTYRGPLSSSGTRYRLTFLDPSPDGTQWEEAQETFLYNKITDGITWYYPKIGWVIRTRYSQVSEEEKESESSESPAQEIEFIRSYITSVTPEPFALNDPNNPVYMFRNIPIGTVINGFPSRY